MRRRARDTLVRAALLVGFGVLCVVWFVMRGFKRIGNPA